MTRVAIYTFLICAVSLSAVGQETQSSPPGATPTPAPPVLKNAETNTGQPPALKGSPGTAVPNTKTAPSADDEVIKVETSLVTTPVSVLDRNGRFIPGLQKKDFKIFDNGVPQKITYFQSSEQPFTVVLMIDTSPSTRYKIDEIHYAAVTFVNQLRASDKVMVVAFDQRIKVLTEEPTSEKSKLYSAIYKAQFGSGTSLYDAVDFIASLDMINVTGRKAVVIFTDGVDTTSRRANYESTLASVQEVDALIYSIRYNTQSAGGVVSTATGAPVALPPDIAALMGARGISIDPRAFRVLGRGTSPAEYERGRLYLDALAQNTGGRMFEAETMTNLEASFSGVAEELRRQYSIGYYPESPGEPGERRTVKIRVTRPNTIVRAKPGYVIRQLRSWHATPWKPGLVASHH